DVARYATRPGCERERSAVTARRVRGDASTRARLGERLHCIGCAAVLERTDALQVLGLDENLRIDPAVERARAEHGRAVHERGDAYGGFVDARPVDAHAPSSPRAARVPGIRRTGTTRRGRAGRRSAR